MGYAGGEVDEPTYHQLGDHAEAVEVTFDPQRVSYQELLDVYWSHFPASLPPGPRRTRTAVFPRDEVQRSAARAAKKQLRRRIGDQVTTEIAPEATFWPAERLHQKFHLQRVHRELVAELAENFADVDAFLATTAAARLNAYVSGFAGEEGLSEAADELGWPVEELRQRLTVAEAES